MACNVYLNIDNIAPGLTKVNVFMSLLTYLNIDLSGSVGIGYPLRTRASTDERANIGHAFSEPKSKPLMNLYFKNLS